MRIADVHQRREAPSMAELIERIAAELEPLVANLGCVSDAFKRDVAKVAPPDS